MTRKNTRVLMLSLMLLAFISQGYALSVVQGGMQMQTGNTSSHLINHDMSGHDMKNMDTKNKQFSSDCCDEDCDCDMASCSSSAAVITIHSNIAQPLALFEAANSYLFLSINTTPTSLFRPPITR